MRPIWHFLMVNLSAVLLRAYRQQQTNFSVFDLIIGEGIGYGYRILFFLIVSLTHVIGTVG